MRLTRNQTILLAYLWLVGDSHLYRIGKARGVTWRRLWSSKMGLLRDGYIYEVDAAAVDGRNRITYGITPLGIQALQKDHTTIYGVALGG